MVIKVNRLHVFIAVLLYVIEKIMRRICNEDHREEPFRDHLVTLIVAFHGMSGSLENMM